jgi:hypothetical protein
VFGIRELWNAVVLAVLAVGYLLCPQRGVDVAMLVLPPIVMTAHGGLEANVETWSIAPDGSWTWRHDIRIRPLRSVSRSGTLSAEQRRELAVLATDPALRAEMRTANPECTISDGPNERLDVGRLRYWTSWCEERRPHVVRIRARLTAMTWG